MVNLWLPWFNYSNYSVFFVRVVSLSALAPSKHIIKLRFITFVLRKQTHTRR